MQIDDILARTLADGRLSRGERKALHAVLDDLDPSRQQIEELRSRVFAMGREALSDPGARKALDWVKDVAGLLLARTGGGNRPLAEAVFGPGTGCRERVRSLFEGARDAADVCVYTITDDRISSAILDAHARGVRIRLLTDDQKADDAGSDIDRLARAGIPVAFDDSPHQMHHKFAIFDRSLLLNGSFNWTRSATEVNQENVVVTDDAGLVRAFAGEFERLWEAFA